MKNIIWLAVLLSACTGPLTTMGAQEPAFTATLATHSAILANETATPDYTYTPAVNYQATAAVAQSTSDAAMRQQAEITLVSIRETAQQSDFERSMILASQTAQAPASTATKAWQNTQAAMVNANGTQMAIVATADEAKPTQIAAVALSESRAKFADVVVLGDALLWPLVIIAVCIAVLALLVYSWRNLSVQRSEETDAEDEPMFEDAGQLYMGGSKGVRIPSDIATRADMKKFVEGLAKHYPLTFRTWTRDASNPNNLFSEQKFSELLTLLERAGLIEWRNDREHRQGATLTQGGRMWVAALAAPLPASDNPELHPRTV